jgi:arylsulfatase A-like enzyme
MGLAGPAAAAEPKRPNILMAFADDWGRCASIFAQVEGAGSMNDVIQTPNIDRVAREGVLFRRAYVNAPSCTPCRSSLLSGQYFWRTGRAAILQGAVWDSKIPSFPLLLRDAGYHIGQTYKVWSPGSPNDAPFGETRYAYEQAGGRFNQFSQNVTQMVQNGRSVEEAKAELYREVIGNFEAFLADRQADQPFCYWFGPTNVHRSWTRGSGQALWGIKPDALQGKLPKFLPDVPEVREDLADYFGEVQAFDHALGLLLQKLEQIGELDNTLVVVSGDHGPPGFTHGKCNLYDFGTGVTLAIRGAGTRGGRVLDDFVGLPDLAPTFLEVAGVTPPDVMTARSLVPLLKSDKSGQVDPQRSFVLTGRERHVEDARTGYLPYPQRAIRTKQYLYILNFEPDRWPMGNPYKLGESDEPDAETLANNTRVTLSDMDAGPTKAWLIKHRDDPQWKPFYEIAFAKRPREQLFVIADDPDQLHNVAADPKYAKVREELHEKLMSELTRTNDPRVTGDRMFFEKPPMAGPLPANPKAKKKAG